MSVTVQPLFEPTALSGAVVALFTAAYTTRVDKLVVSNPFSTQGSVEVFLVPQGRAANQGSMVIPARPVSPLASMDLPEAMGLVLNAGDALWATCGSSTNQLIMFGAGTVVTG
jgi:hypothetical protein